MQQSLSELLKHYLERVELSVGRVANQAEIPKQTLFNWCAGRMPRWHSGLPTDLHNLSRALGLSSREADGLLLAAGCVCAIDSPNLEDSDMNTLTMPNGWHRAGSQPSQYDMGVDPSRSLDGAASVLVRSRVSPADGFGTLMQSCLGTEFLGKRVRLSAMACCEDIKESAGLWFRVDGRNSRTPLNFDNMSDRALTGTLDWAHYAVVLDISEQSSGVAYGVLLSGTGSVWISGVTIEVVGLDVPSTNMERMGGGAPPGPVNLDFA